MFEADYMVEHISAILADSRKKPLPQSEAIARGLVASRIIEAFNAAISGKRAVSVQYLKERLAALENCNGMDKSYLSAYYADSYKSNVANTVEAAVARVCVQCMASIAGRLEEGGGVIRDHGIGREDALDLDLIALAVHTRVEACLKGAEAVTNAEELGLLPDMLVAMTPPALGIQNGPSEYTAVHGVCPMITELNSYVETLKNMALLCVWYGIDLRTHIALEVAYNRAKKS